MSNPTDKPSPFKLNGTRIGIIAMLLLAIVTIIAATLGGGVNQYEALKEGAQQQTGTN